jgi:hypothetical protein
MAEPAGDVEPLRNRIRAAIAADRGPRRFTRREWLAAAAGTIVAVGGWRWSTLDDTPVPGMTPAAVDPAMYAATAQSHQVCAVMRPAPEAPPTPEEIRTRLRRYAGVADVIRERPQGFEVRDVHVCPNGDRLYAHVVLTRDHETVSVFVSEAKWGDLPPGTATFDLAGARRAQLVREGDFEIGAVQRGPRVGFVVSSRDAEAHVSLAQPWLTSVDRFLADLERRQPE